MYYSVSTSMREVGKSIGILGNIIQRKDPNKFPHRYAGQELTTRTIS